MNSSPHDVTRGVVINGGCIQPWWLEQWVAGWAIDSRHIAVRLHFGIRRLVEDRWELHHVPHSGFQTGTLHFSPFLSIIVSHKASLPISRAEEQTPAWHTCTVGRHWGHLYGLTHHESFDALSRPVGTVGLDTLGPVD